MNGEFNCKTIHVIANQQTIRANLIFFPFLFSMTKTFFLFIKFPTFSFSPLDLFLLKTVIAEHILIFFKLLIQTNDELITVYPLQYVQADRKPCSKCLLCVFLICVFLIQGLKFCRRNLRYYYSNYFLQHLALSTTKLK